MTEFHFLDGIERKFKVIVFILSLGLFAAILWPKDEFNISFYFFSFAYLYALLKLMGQFFLIRKTAKSVDICEKRLNIKPVVGKKVTWTIGTFSCLEKEPGVFQKNFLDSFNLIFINERKTITISYDEEYYFLIFDNVSSLDKFITEINKSKAGD
ncbi:hypothetical protein G5S52_05370 [Grimontia sp. S25]|uniref:Uncharacterized protein n=1 Tax=Grimontia sedimenti TaxID=2711294 RepID=A0A6M1RFM3_9GAMM|nr:hypothetical protein [Grimontia sedimenti]NGN97101.1 hypothetical protein [Grimontia sedimenti]